MNIIAETILDQSGRNKFIAMTGAKNFVAGNNNLYFSIGGGANRSINKVKITLNSQDLYDMTFYRQRGIDLTVVAERKNIMAENLRKTFSDVTGFDTALASKFPTELEEAQSVKIKNTTATKVYAALVAVNAHDPDYAREINYVGFNKFDGQFARDLIEKGQRWGWTQKQYDAAKKLANKYRRQVAANGIDVQEMLDEKPQMPEVTVEDKKVPQNVKLYLPRRPEMHGKAYYVLGQHVGGTLVKLIGESSTEEIEGNPFSRFSIAQDQETPQKKEFKGKIKHIRHPHRHKAEPVGNPNDIKYFFNRAIGYADPEQIKQLHWFVENNIIFIYDPNIDVEQEEDPKNPNTVHTLISWQRLADDTLQQAHWQVTVADIAKYLTQLGSQPLQGKKAEDLKYDPIANTGDSVEPLQIDPYRK